MTETRDKDVDTPLPKMADVSVRVSCALRRTHHDKCSIAERGGKGSDIHHNQPRVAMISSPEKAQRPFVPGADEEREFRLQTSTISIIEEVEH